MFLQSSYSLEYCMWGPEKKLLPNTWNHVKEICWGGKGKKTNTQTCSVSFKCFSPFSQLLSRSPAVSKNSEDKLIWSGWFCCVSGDDLPENVPEDFTWLPLFLANGAESYTAIVGSWFQKTFDCCFRRLAISPLSLSWMAAMWTGCKADKTPSALELIFSVPCLPQPLDISYAIHPEDAKALWDTVQKTPGEITQEEVDVFMDCLYSHFHRHFKIHLSATRLVKVSTSIASAHCDGTIKVSFEVVCCPNSCWTNPVAVTDFWKWRVCFSCQISYKKLLNPLLLLLIVGAAVEIAIDPVFYYCVTAEATNPRHGPGVGVSGVVQTRKSLLPDVQDLVFNPQLYDF